nr:hypothetical protein [Mucilaginibacter sp. L294]
MITFTVTVLLIIIVYGVSKWTKRRSEANPVLSGRSGNLERKDDGTLVAYIAFWRYLFFGVLFALAFYICMNAFVRLYQELPPGFYKSWDKPASITLFMLILAIAMLIWGYWLLKGGYKKVQFELTKYNVRYLKSGVRGGILLSDNDIFVSLRDITGVQLRQNMLGGGVITARTATQTHKMILLLSAEEQQVCYQALQEAIHNRQLNSRPL